MRPAGTAEKNDSSTLKEAGETKVSKQESEDSETQKPVSATESTSVPDEAENPNGGGENENAGATNVLVVYFSATNTTKGVTEYMADGLRADLYEIVPQEPYTDDDLDYNDDNSRSTMEMSDPAVRPAISGSVDNMDQYDVVFIGFPIWWETAPRIIDTFIESYDFSGKTVITFCTSGSSGIGTASSNLKKLCKGNPTWKRGRRFDGDVSQSTVNKWVDGFRLK